MLLSVQHHLAAGGHVWLGLDYDGTLAPISLESGQAKPDPSLCSLLTGLAENPLLRIAIVSGRPLSFLRAVLPVSGLTLAGVYGLEVQMPGGERLLRVESNLLRPQLRMIKSDWSLLFRGHPGYWVEDKELALALHADSADPAETALLLSTAISMATERPSPVPLRVYEGDRYLEVAPAAAHKGQTVQWLLDQDWSHKALPVYVGDDARDEEAFEVIRRRGGIPILVGKGSGSTRALARLGSCEAVRTWLEILCEAASRRHRSPTS